MKKTGIALLSALCLACPGLDLMLRNGMMLNNVTILNTTPFGVSISADQGGMGENIVTRTVKYTDLTESSFGALLQALQRKAAALNPAAGTGLTDSVSAPLAALTPDSFVPLYSGPYHTSGILLPGYPRRIELQSILMLFNGTLGWAQSAEIPVTPGTENFGRMYVYGIFIPGGGTWYGNVYPTNKRIYHRGRFYPCYATGIHTAEKINASVQD